MPRKNIDGMWGESQVITVRCGVNERGALQGLRSAWGGTDSSILSRTLHESDRRAELNARAEPPETLQKGDVSKNRREISQ